MVFACRGILSSNMAVSDPQSKNLALRASALPIQDTAPASSGACFDPSKCAPVALWVGDKRIHDRKPLCDQRYLRDAISVILAITTGHLLCFSFDGDEGNA